MRSLLDGRNEVINNIPVKHTWQTGATDRYVISYLLNVMQVHTSSVVINVCKSERA
jgi:hypothetical protein